MQENREKLFDAAKKLFVEYSPKGVTIDMIVKEAKVGKGTFYNYFKNKEDLYEQIVDSYILSVSNLKKEKYFDYPDIKDQLIAIFVGTSISAYNDDIIKNFFLKNENYFIGKIDYSYLRTHHKQSMKELLRSEFSDEELTILSELLWIYTKTLIEKESQYKQDKLERFSLQFANILVNGYFENNYDNGNVQYKDIKNNIICFKKNIGKN